MYGDCATMTRISLLVFQRRKRRSLYKDRKMSREQTAQIATCIHACDKVAFDVCFGCLGNLPELLLFLQCNTAIHLTQEIEPAAG